MARVLLIHWNRAEAEERAKRLRAARHQVVTHAEEGGGPALRALRDDPPDAVVIDQTPAKPIVPGTMDGYSGTPLSKKLGIKTDCTLILLGAPEGFDRTLGTLPDGVAVRRQSRGRADVIVLFVKSQAEFQRRFPAAKRAMSEGGGLWIAWPKKASGLATDLTQADVRAFGLASGLVDYKICAIDATWSGLKFARRRS